LNLFSMRRSLIRRDLLISGDPQVGATRAGISLSAASQAMRSSRPSLPLLRGCVPPCAKMVRCHAAPTRVRATASVYAGMVWLYRTCVACASGAVKRCFGLLYFGRSFGQATYACANGINGRTSLAVTPRAYCHQIGRRFVQLRQERHSTGKDVIAPLHLSIRLSKQRQSE
jgi:hypothetical protein